MPKDNQSEEADLLKANGNDESGESDDQHDQQDQKQGDQQHDDQKDGGQQGDEQDESGYRSKLNATNRFLEKEGYEFRDGRWHKKADAKQERSGSQQEQKPATPASLTRDEAIVIAKGYSEEELEHAKKVAVLENCTPVKALEKDLFTTWKEKRDADAKERKAQLGVSRGSKATIKKSLNTPGLTEEEHREMFQNKIGK